MESVEWVPMPKDSTLAFCFFADEANTTATNTRC